MILEMQQQSIQKHIDKIWINNQDTNAFEDDEDTKSKVRKIKKKEKEKINVNQLIVNANFRLTIKD